MNALSGAAIAAILVLALSVLLEFEAGWLDIAIVAVLAAAAIAACLRFASVRSQGRSKRDD